MYFNFKITKFITWNWLHDNDKNETKYSVSDHIALHTCVISQYMHNYIYIHVYINKSIKVAKNSSGIYITYFKLSCYRYQATCILLLTSNNNEQTNEDESSY